VNDERPRRPELEEKQRRVAGFLADAGLAGMVLGTQAGFAWATCGADNHVAVAAERGSCTLLLGKDRWYCIANRVEAPRLKTEELVGLDFEIVAHEWFEDPVGDLLEKLCPGPKASDVALPGCTTLAAEIGQLRWSLTEQEVERYREAGRLAAEAMEQAVLAVQPGMSEHEMGALLSAEVCKRGMVPAVVLIAADERIFSYRHPIPTDNRLERYAMLVLVARKWGLHVSLTRFVHFGRVAEELRRKQAATARVDAVFIEGTKPGAAVAEVFDAALRAYAEAGFAEEWHLHHQGGATGYEPRSYRASPGIGHRVQANQAFAWNPSITGAKSEDTIIATPAGTEVISATPRLPVMRVSVGGREWARPDVLVR